MPKDTKKKITRLVKLAKINGTIPRSAPQTLPYDEMKRSGVCRAGKDYYTKSIEFGDINYKLAKRATKEKIFDQWCNFLNYNDSSVDMQLTFVNLYRDIEQYYSSIAIPEQEDAYNYLRREYSAFLRNQLEKGSNGMEKRKIVTFGIHAENQEAALTRLERMQTKMISDFQNDIHAKAEHMNGYQRMEVMHDILNIGTDRKLNFNWELIAKTGLTTRDFISPNSFDFSRKNVFELQNVIGRASYIRISAPELADDFLSELLDMDSPIIVSIHFRSIEQLAAKEYANQLLADLNAMKAQLQRKNYDQGFDMDILPAELQSNIEDAQALVDNLKDRNERMFEATFTIVQFGQDEQELENVFTTAKQVSQQHGCELLPLDWQQEAGLMSALPIGLNTVDIHRMLPTSNLAVFIPFQTQELFQSGGLYYGLNSLSNNIIMIDRLLAKNPNALVLGVPGSGKSVFAKLEIFSIALIKPNDDTLILDPEREYSPLVNALGGQVIRISADSRDHINPLDLNLSSRSEEDSDFDPIRDKCDFILSFCEQALNSRDGLQPIEVSVIDRCVMAVYDKYTADPKAENMPTLQDLYELLLEQPELEAQRVATGLERFVTGSLNVFNHPTNVEIKNRIVCFDTKDLANNLKKLGMLVVQDQIWARVRRNREKRKITRYYADEFHLLLRDAQTAAASIEIWKRFRKWGGVPCALTQNVKDFLATPDIENIFENSDFICLLSQAPGDQRILANALNISEDQLTYVTNSKPGHGLIIFKRENAIIPFANEFPKDTQLYRLITTKLDEVTV